MAKIRLLGVQDLDFTSNDGNQIKGIKIHYAYSTNNVFGNAVGTKFFSEGLCSKLCITSNDLRSMVDNEVNVDTDLNGHIVDIG